MSTPRGTPLIRIRVPDTVDNPWRDSMELSIAIRQPNGRIAIAKPVEFAELDDNEICGVIEPAFSAQINGDGENLLRSIMDQLWAIGIRPSDIGTPGHLASTQQHLEDMRKIAFSQLGIK